MATRDIHQLQTSVIAAALHAAGLDQVRVRVDAQGRCELSGCVADAEQEGLARQVAARAGLKSISLRLVHLGARTTEVDVQTHRVADGETWWSIAQAHYGDGEMHRKLREANGNPRDLKSGDVIVLPRDL